MQTQQLRKRFEHDLRAFADREGVYIHFDQSSDGQYKEVSIRLAYAAFLAGVELRKTLMHDADVAGPTFDPMLAPCPFCGGTAGFYRQAQGNFRDGITEPFNAWLAGCISNACSVHVDTEGDISKEEAAAKWNSRRGKPKEWLVKLIEKMDDWSMQQTRWELYSLCDELGMYDVAAKVCQLFYFEDSDQVVAANNVEDILQSPYFSEFHDRVKRQHFVVLSWYDEVEGYSLSELVPCSALPELVLGPVAPSTPGYPSD